MAQMNPVLSGIRAGVAEGIKDFFAPTLAVLRFLIGGSRGSRGGHGRQR